MMRCFACNMDLGPTAPIDRPTGRFYCTECFEPTLQVQLAAASVEIEWERITESELSFSFQGVADVLEVEGWGTVPDLFHIEDYEEEKEEDQ